MLQCDKAIQMKKSISVMVSHQQHCLLNRGSGNPVVFSNSDKLLYQNIFSFHDNIKRPYDKLKELKYDNPGV